jgi:filamentous hemagglutinin family protein
MKIKFYRSFLTLASLVAIAQPTQAQTYQPSNRTPVADNTLGTQVSGNGTNFSITGGLNKGQTLFHSFTDFSVPTNGQANFNNPVGNRDIITRVTGGVFSDINGLVNTNGANFFLINPNGIVFGTNAQLNVGRAFMASTANGLNLVDGAGNPITFGTNTNGDPLLKIAPNVLFNVSSLTMGGGSGQISNFGTLQTTNPSQYIGLIGGNVSMNGGQIDAPTGRVELGGLSAAGTVTLGLDGNVIRAQFPTNVVRGDVSLTNQARVNIAGGGGEDLSINARNIDVLGESRIRGGIDAGLGTPESVAGDINLNATGDIAIRSGSSIDSIVRSNSKGKAGNIILTAKNAVFLVNSNIFSAIAAGGVGKGGDININASSLSLQDNAQIQTITDEASANQPAGQGNAGNVNVKVTGTVTIAGNTATSGILSSVYTGIGKGGNITIDAGTVSLRDDALLSASTYGQGNAGNVTVTAKDAVSLVRKAAIFSAVEVGSMGKGGNIDINAGSLSLQDLGVISSSTVGESTTQPGGQGNAGNINVKVTGVIDIAGTGVVDIDGTKNTFPSGIFSLVGNGTKGNGGNITVDTSSFSLQDGAQILASTFGQGNAGKITVNATDFVTITGKNDNSTVVSVESQSPTGTAGDIIVISPKITLDRGGAIDATSVSSKGGNIKIGGKLPAQSTDLLLLRRGGRISTDAGGTAQVGDNGGNIDINSQLIVAIPKENSDITATAIKGRGGNINIDSKGLFGIQSRPLRTDNSDITASSDFDRQGTVNIDTPGTDPGRDSTELPNTTTDSSNQISQVCSADNRQNKLTVAGRGGLPPNANDPLTSDVVWQDARATSSQPTVSIAPTPAKLAPPAVGWVFDGKGKVTLIAAGTQGQTGTRVACPQGMSK